MEYNVPYEHSRDVLSDEGGITPYAGRRCHYQHDFCQRGHAQPAIARLRHHERRYSEFYRRLGATVGREGHSGELCSTGTHLDAADSLNYACGKGEVIWGTDSDEAARPTQRARSGLCHVGKR